MDDLIERLHCGADIKETWHELATRTNNERAEAASEIERLRNALRYEERRFGMIGRHSDHCHTYGFGHYECALREIERLQQKIDALELKNSSGDGLGY